jgi:antirestriction protein ArdC
MNKKSEKTNIYAEITEKIITALDDGVIPWARPWDAVQYGLFRNALTNRPSRGLNTILLYLVAMLKGFVDPRWLTFRNAEKLGGSIRKGEKGVHVIFWKFLPLRAESAPPDFDPEPDENRQQKVIPCARAYTVFNVEQCEGLDLPALEPGEVVEQENNELAEKILTMPVMKHGGSRAYYSRSGDFIAMPVRETFENLDFYFSTAYHEVIHYAEFRIMPRRYG